MNCSYAKLKPAPANKTETASHTVVVPILKNINLKIKPGQRIAVIGGHGVGKSFFLRSLIGETYLSKGKHYCNGRIAFLPKNTSFIEDSIYQNIVWGEEYNREKYHSVIEMCQLKAALDNLKGSHRFIIMEDASNISTMVRRKIMLARILYRDYDLYIFDEFLDKFDAQFLKYFLDVILE